MDLNIFRKVYLYLNHFFASISRISIGAFHGLYLNFDSIIDCDSIKDVPTVMAWMVYLLLLFKPVPFPIYAIGRTDRVRILSNGIFWNSDCVDKIVHLRKRARKFNIYAYLDQVIFATLYWTWNAYQNYTGTWREVVIIAYIPVFSVIGNFGVFGIVFFIDLSIRYFQIRQDALLSRLELFTSEWAKKKQSKGTNAHINVIWQRFCVLNQDILRFNTELSEYSAYWCPFITIIFVAYIGLDTLLLYGMIFQTEHVYSTKVSLCACAFAQCTAFKMGTHSPPGAAEFYFYSRKS